MSLRRWLPPLGWAAVILLVSSVPVPSVPAPEGADKGVHGFLYLVLGLLAGQALLGGRSARGWQLLVLLLGLSLFGALDEVHQLWIAGRTADVRDWVADTVGSIVGVAMAVVRSATASRALS